MVFKIKKAISLFLILVGALSFALAQTQQGYVKTKGRMVNGKYTAGKRISGVTVQIKDRSAVLSKADGSFSFPIPSKKYSLEKVTKQGYVLLDQDVLYRQYAYSANPLELVMEDKAQLDADRRAIERKVRKITEDELHRREVELDSLKEHNKITEERYRELLNKLNNDFDNNEKLVKEMVEQYNKIDFDQLDEFNRRISDCIINGRLDEADSLLRTKGDISKRARELSQLSEANAAAQSKLDKSKAMESKKREDLAKDCYNWFLTYKMRHQNDSAAYYIEMRASLDTTNAEWQDEAGSFIDEYIADYDKTLEYYKKALAIREKKLGKEHPDVATSYNNIGFVYSKQGNDDKALEYHNKSLAIREKVFGKEHPDVAISYSNIGAVYSNQGNYDMALEYYNNALAIREKVLGNEHPQVATSYNNIGFVYSTQGKYDKALEYFNKALAILEKVFGKEHPDVATSYNGIGGIYVRQRNYDKVLEYYYKTLAIQEKVYGKDHPRVAASYSNIGAVYSIQRKYDKALEYYNKALAIQEKILGKEHPDVATSYNNIGIVYYNQRNYDKALEYYNKALAIREKKLGKEHQKTQKTIDVINNIKQLQQKIEESKK